jgi:hypothetical protein
MFYLLGLTKVRWLISCMAQQNQEATDWTQAWTQERSLKFEYKADRKPYTRILSMKQKNVFEVNYCEIDRK